MQTLIHVLILGLQCSTRLATCNFSENELIAKFARVSTSLKLPGIQYLKLGVNYVHECVLLNASQQLGVCCIRYCTVPPRASICQNERTAVAGATVTFQCLATGDEPIQFMWQLPRFNPRATASGGSLTIYDVRSSDSGEYKCTAKNPYIGMPSLRVSNATARLMVQSKAGISVRTSSCCA